MVFDNKNAAFRVLSAVDFQDENRKTVTHPRSFCSLSFRIHTDAQIFCCGKSYSFQDGDILFIPMNTLYTRVSKKDKLIAIHFEMFNDETDEICVYSPRDKDRFHRLFSELLQVYNDKKPGYAYGTAALLNQIFMEIQKERGEQSKLSPRIERARNYMKENYTNPQLTIPEIAAACAISEGYFRRQFRKETGISPKEALNKIRMQAASSLLNSGFYTVSEVAERVGFFDTKYFSTAYKKYAAVSPTAYRRTKQNVQKIFG